jgi:hypothetical protein
MENGIRLENPFYKSPRKAVTPIAEPPHRVRQKIESIFESAKTKSARNQGHALRANG